MFMLGQIGLVFLTVGAVAAALAPQSWSSQSRRWMTVAAAAGGGLAVLVLVIAFLSEDWRFEYTVGHARPEIAWPLRMAGLWAGPEGSLLLWTTLLALAAVVVISFETSAWSSRLLAVPTAAYGLTLLTVSKPFKQLAAPPGRGNGLQPVLEHPAMVWHPPILYLGLIGLLIPVAWILGSGAGSFRTPQSCRTPLPSLTGPALCLALGLLTAGLGTGANWAYVELGWGGYWAWDPIENAGLVAWLAAASMLHRFDPDPGKSASPIPNPDPNDLPSVAITGSAVIIGSAVIWATTITRTGVLSSVHSFADQPRLRNTLLASAIVVTGTFVVAAVAGRRSTRDQDAPSSPGRSRIAALVVLLAAAVVAVGTYEPAIEMFVNDEPFALSGRFYTVLLWPVAVVGSGGRVWATVSTTRLSASKPSASKPSASIPLLVTVVGAVAAMVFIGGAVGPFALGLAAVGGAVAASSVIDVIAGRSTAPARGWLTHLGIGLLLIGVAGTVGASQTTVVALIDQQADTAAGLVTHRGIELEEVSGTSQAVATVELIRPGDTKPNSFQPRLVRYETTGASSAEVATNRGWLTDVQVVLLDADAAQATYRITVQPRISLVWLGAMLISTGLIAAARPRPTGPND